MFKTDDTTITIQMKISVRNSREEVVEGLQFPFQTVIESNGEDLGCADATATFVSVAQDKYIAFAASDASTVIQQKSIQIKSALRATSSDDKCPIKYKLQLAGTDGAFIDYEDRKYALLEDETFTEDRFPLDVSWNSDTAALNITVTSAFESVKDFFTINGQISISLRVLVIIPGSNAHGPALPDTQQIQGEFKIKHLESTEVEVCSGNYLDLQEFFVDGSQREYGYVKYEIPNYTPPAVGEDEPARQEMQIRPYQVFPLKSMADCPIKIEAYIWKESEGDWEQVRNGQYTDISNLNFDQQDPYVTFKLSQKEYINDFAKDYSYDFNGSVPPSTFIYAKFVMYDPTDEEGTKKEDFFNLEVVSSGQLASAFCNFGALSVVDGTQKSNKNYYTTGSGPQHVLMQTQIEGWTDDSCKKDVKVGVQVQYPGSNDWRTVAQETEYKPEEPPMECMCAPEYYEHATTHRQLAEERQSADFMPVDPMPAACECIDSSHTEKKMWIEADGEFYILNIDLTREDLYEMIQVELMTDNSPLEVIMRFVWQDAAGSNIDQLNQQFILRIKDGEPTAENLCKDATVALYSSVKDGYLAFNEYDEWTTYNERKSVEFREALKTKPDVKGCDAKYKLAVFDKDANTFIEAWQMELKMKAETSEFSSSVSIDSNNANVWASFSRKDITELASRFDQGYIEFMVVAVVPYSDVAGPGSNMQDLPMATFKLHLVDNNEVKQCRDNSLELTDETYSGETRGELVYKIRTADEVSNGGELEMNIPARRVNPSKPNCQVVSYAQYEVMGWNEEYGYHMSEWKDIRDDKYNTVATPPTGTFVTKISQIDYIDDLSKQFGNAAGYGHMMDETLPEIWIHVRVVTFDVTQEWNTIEDDFWVKVESSGETKVDVACKDAFNNLAVKAGTEMTQDRTYKVGTFKEIPISLELEGEDNLAEECQNLYYLSLNVLMPGDAGRKEEIANERGENKICFKEDGDYEFSGEWNWENMHEYKDEIKVCKKPFIKINNGNIEIDMSQQNFTDVVQFELKQSGNLVDAYLIVAYRDSNGNIIAGTESQFVLSITGDNTAPTLDCSGAEVTLSSKTQTEYMSFGEYVDGETDRSWQMVMLPKALETKLNDGHEECPVKYRMQVFDCPADKWKDLGDFLDGMKSSVVSTIKLNSKISFNPDTADLTVEFTNEDMYGQGRNLVNFFQGCGMKIKYRIFVVVPGSATMGPSSDESANIYEDFEIEIVEPTVAATCDGAYLSTIDTTSYNATSRYDFVNYYIPAKGEQPHEAVIPALDVISNKDFSDCPIITTAKWNNNGKWEDVRENDYVKLHLNTAERYFTIDISQERYINDIAWQYGAHEETDDKNKTVHLPKSAVIEVAFITYDKANKNMSAIWDYVNIEIFSNGATSLSEAACDFSSVVIRAGTEMSGTRTYQVNVEGSEINTRRFDIPIVVDGLDTLTPAYCKDEVYMTLEMQRSNQKWREMWNNKNDYYWNEHNDYRVKIEQTGEFYELAVEVSAEDFRKFQVDHRSNDPSFDVPVKISWRDGGDNELVSNQITIKIKGAQEESKCKDATLAFKGATRDLTMAWNSAAGADADMATSGEQLHFYAEKSVEVNVESENHCPVYFQLEVYHALNGAWVDYSDWVDDIKSAVTAATPDEWFSSGIWFDNNNAYISGWFSGANMEVLATDFFTINSEKYLKLRVRAFAPGSDVAGAAADDNELVVREIKVKIFSGDNFDTCNNNELFLDVTTDYDGNQRVGGMNMTYQIAADDSAPEGIIPARKVTGKSGCPLVTYAQYMKEECYEYDTDGDNSTEGMTRYCYERWVDLRTNDYINTYFGEGESRYFVVTMKQGEYIQQFAANGTIAVPPSVDIRVKFITYDPTNEWGSRIEDELTVTILSSGQVASDLCDWTTVVASEGISGDWWYDIPTPGTENLQRLPLLTEVSGFDKGCRELTYWTLDVHLPRGGQPVWETVWTQGQYDYECMIPEGCPDMEQEKKYIWIEENKKYHEILINFDQELFVNTIQVSLESGNQTVKADFRVALRDEEGRVIEQPTNANKFTLHVVGQPEYVNPCKDIGSIVKSVLDRDFSVSFGETDENSPEQMKYLEASQPLVIRGDDETIEHECPVFYKLYVMKVSSGQYLDWKTYTVELEETFGKLESYVSIDSQGNLKAGFKKTEVDLLRDTFFDQATNEAAISLRVMAGIVGSEIVGPANITALESKEFKIKFVSNELVATCASATLEKDSITNFDGEQRGSIVDYNIYTQAEVEAESGAQRAVKIKALKVHNSMATQGCVLETFVEWSNPMNNYQWEALRANDYLTLHMAQNELYVTIQMSQKQYMEKVLPALGYDNTHQIPEQVYVVVRFVTFNPANDEQIIEDTLEIMIYSSNEDATKLCENDFANLAVDQEFNMIDMHYYQVGEGERDGWEKPIFVSTQLNGLDTLGEGCIELFRTAVDYKSKNNHWIQIWSEWDVFEKGDRENFRIERTSGLANMYVSLKHEDYSILAGEFETDAKAINITMRIAFKDAKQVVLASDEFTIEFSDIEEVVEMPCATAILTKENASRDLFLSFAANTASGVVDDKQEFSVPKTLVTKFDDNHKDKDCQVTYRLFCFNKNTDTYQPWKDVIEYIKFDATETIWSEIQFDQNTADLSGIIYKSDVELLRPYFNDGSEDQFKFRVQASVKGNAYDATAIVTGDFNVKLVDNTQVETCSGIELTITQETVYDPDETRGDVIYYDIPTQNNPELEKIIPALQVASNKDRATCPIVTIAQWYNPHLGMWEDVRDNEYNTMYMDDETKLYTKFKITQQQYLEGFGHYHAKMTDNTMHAGDLPNSVEIKARFLTWAVADYNSTLIEDTFFLNITTSGETQLDFCQTEFSNALSKTGSMDDREYQISDEDYVAEVKSFFLQTKFEAASLSSNCEHEYFMALQTEISTDKWKVMWSEREYYSNSQYLWVEQDSATGFYNINVAISHYDYEREVQLMYGKVKKEIDIKMRIVLLDSKGNLIPDMKDQFELKIKDNDKVSQCIQATVEKKTQVREEFSISFKGEEEYAQLDISRCLETTPIDQTLMDCNAFYTLWAYHESQGKWESWETMVAILEETLGRHMESYLYFDRENGNMHASLSKADVNGVRHLFEFTGAAGQVEAVKFQVRAVIPGSEAQGAETDKDDLITAEFMVRLVKEAEVETCAGNSIRWDGLTKLSGAEREPYKYEIPKAGEADLSMNIEALKLISTKNDCPVEMVAQFFNGYFDNSINEWVGEWTEVRTDTYQTNEMNDKTKRSFKFEITQKQYIAELSKMYAITDMSQIAPETKLRYRFVAWDPTDFNSTMIQEEISLTVVSSGQTGAAICDFSALSLDDKITGTRKYRVGQTDEDGYHISTKIAGINNLVDASCEQELYMAVELNVGGGITEQVWSEDPYITSGSYIYNQFFWVKDGRIQIKISNDDFVNHFQKKFATLDTTISTTMSLVWYDSEGKPFDGNNGRPDLTNTFNLEIRDKELETEDPADNKCAQAARRLISGANDQYVSFSTDASVMDAETSYGHFSIPQIIVTEPTTDSMYLNCSVSYELYVLDTDHADANSHTYVKWEVALEKIKNKIKAVGEGTLAQQLMSTSFYLDKTQGYFSAELTNKAVATLKDSFPNPLMAAQDAKAKLQFRAYAMVGRSEAQGPASPLNNLISADFTVHFVDFTQTATCETVNLQLSDVTKADDTTRDDWLEFTIQTKEQVENDGQATWTVPGRKVRSNKDFSDCPIVSTIEMMNTEGWYEPFLGNDYCTIDMDNLKLDCQITQTYYLEEMVYKYTGHYEDPGMLMYHFRYVHQDQTRPWETIKYDNITVVVKSSNETRADYCDFTSLAINEQTRMDRSNRQYKIGTGDNDGKLQQYLITTQIDNLDGLSHSCASQLYLTLDIQLPSLTWQTISTEGEEYQPDMNGPKRGVWLYEDEDFTYIMASITQDNYVEYTQPMFETNATYVEVPMRLTIRNGANKTVPALSQQFKFNITSNGQANKCAASTVEKVSETLAVQSFAFSANATEFGQVYNFSVPDTLVTMAHNLAEAECRPKYRIKVLNRLTNTYMYWKDLTEEFVTQFPDHRFESDIHFDESNAMLNCSFSFWDVEKTKDYFTNDGELAIDFRVVAFLPGSEQMSASMSDEQLIHIDFKLVVVEQEKVNACNELQLFDTQATHDGSSRYEEGKWAIEYTIATKDATEQNSVTVPANKIKKSVTECPTVTILEIYKPQWNDEYDYMGGEYAEVRQDQYIILNLNTEQPTMTFSTNQKAYIDYWTKRWNQSENSSATQNADGTYTLDLPQSEWISFRFVTWSPVDPENKIYDYFSIEVNTSGESPSLLCDWEANLSVDPERTFTAPRTYKLKADRYEKNYVRTLIPTEIEGLDELDSQCKSLIHATIDVQMLSDRWNTTWNSTEQEMGWNNWQIEEGHMPVYIETDEDNFRYLIVNMNQEQFEDGIQFEFETNDQSITFQMRIAVRDGDNNVIEHLTQEWTQTVIGNGDVSPCADSSVTLTGQTSDLTMAFDINAANQEWDAYASFWVENPVSVDRTYMQPGCTEVRYKLKVKNPATGEYIYYADLKNKLKEVGFTDLNMSIWFNDGANGEQMSDASVSYSYLSGSFSYSDMSKLSTDGQTLKDYFTNDDGDTILEFIIYAIVPGSSTQGPGMANDNNAAKAEFKVKLIPEEDVTKCDGNEIYFNDVVDVATGAKRDDPVVYQIFNKGEVDNNGGQNLVTLLARTVTTAKKRSDCPLQWQLEWEVPQWNEYSKEYYGNWKVVRDSENIALSLTDGEVISADLEISQNDYLEYWATRYGEDHPEDSTLVNFRFVVWDPTKYQWSTRKEDQFTVEVRSSQETQASFCDYEMLSIDETISGDRTYDIVEAGKEPYLFDIFVSTKLVEDGVVGEGCVD